MIGVLISFSKYVESYCIGTLKSKKKYIRGNKSPFRNNILSKEIMKKTKQNKTRLRNNFLENRTEENRKNTPSKETFVYHY